MYTVELNETFAESTGLLAFLSDLSQAVTSLDLPSLLTHKGWAPAE